MADKISTHKSYHNSGDVNFDSRGSGGISHEHPDKQYWNGNPDAKGPLYKDSDGVWRDATGNVFRGGTNDGKQSKNKR